CEKMISFFRCVEMVRPLAAVSKKSAGSNLGFAARLGDPFPRGISVCLGLFARTILRLPLPPSLANKHKRGGTLPRPLIPMFACPRHRCCRWESTDFGTSPLLSVLSQLIAVQCYVGFRSRVGKSTSKDKTRPSSHTCPVGR